MSSPRGIFPAFVDQQGRIKFDFASTAHAFTRAHFAEDEVYVEIYKRKSKRSLKQNAAYHAAIAPLAEQLGYTVEELKLAMLGGAFGWHDEGPLKGLPLILHTSDLDTEKFSDLMAYTNQIAAEHDILILDPSQWKAEKRKSQRKAAKAAKGRTMDENDRKDEQPETTTTTDATSTTLPEGQTQTTNQGDGSGQVDDETTEQPEGAAV